MRHIIPISGKDSLATAMWQRELAPSLPYEFVFNDTKAELPETYSWLDEVERNLGIEIVRIGKSLEQVIEEKGILPSPRIRFCTEHSKILPMDRFIGENQATVYFGLRADELERVGAFKTKKVLPKYPLREAGIGLATVYRIVRDMMPPAFFWQRLWNAVVPQVGEPHDWPAWMTARVFAWRSRPNCYFCFFQRRYEWVGLLEHHPKLFDRAEEIEQATGKGPDVRRSTGIQWIAADVPLSKIREQRDTIFAKRVDAVCRLIDSSRQSELFADSIDEMDIAATSCGLLCGK